MTTSRPAAESITREPNRPVPDLPAAAAAVARHPTSSVLLSFLIPVCNDAARLTRCLRSIRLGTPDVPIEIIVGDNGSTDDSAAVAERARATVLSLAGKSVAQVRNALAQSAKAPLLAFVDADHEIDATWTSTALPLFDDPTVAAVGAQYSAPPDGSWVQRTYDLLRRRTTVVAETDWLPGGNCVIRRDLFVRAGGFDESLETCEDVDLSHRLRRAGGRLLEVPPLLSVHYGDPATLAALFRGELWRGRDSLRVTLREAIAPRAILSLCWPLVELIGLVSVPVLVVAGWWSLLTLPLGAMALLITLRGLLLYHRAPRSSRGWVLAGRTFAVAAAYDLARALALVARRGHATRRQTPGRRR